MKKETLFRQFVKQVKTLARDRSGKKELLVTTKDGEVLKVTISVEEARRLKLIAGKDQKD